MLLVWGPLMVGGTAFAATGVWNWQIAAIGSAFALGPTSVIFGKHIDKLDFDRDKGVATLPVRLGPVAARAWVRWMLVLQYLATAALILSGWLPWPVLLVVLALPKMLGPGVSLQKLHHRRRLKVFLRAPGRSGIPLMLSIIPAGLACCFWLDSVWRCYCLEMPAALLE